MSESGTRKSLTWYGKKEFSLARKGILAFGGIATWLAIQYWGVL